MPNLRLKILSNTSDFDIQAGGLKFGFFYLIVLVASINSGNNLIYLVLSFLTGALIVNWTLASLSMRGLSVSVRLPDEIFAGEETGIEFYVSKGWTLMQAQSLVLTIRKGNTVEDYHRPYIERIAKGESRRAKGTARFPLRGIVTLAGAQVHCTYPFGLFSPGKLFKQPQELVIYPKLLPLEDMLEYKSEGMHNLDSCFRGQGGGLFNIRPFQPGDDFRRVHWKATAKLDVMMVKEFTREEGQAIWIHFNPLRMEKSQPRNEEIFELGVSVAASLAYHGLQQGLEPLFSAPGLRLAPRNRDNQAGDFLRYLATVKAEGRMLSDSPIVAQHRCGDELLVIIDPLNQGLSWDSEALVLDRDYFTSLLEQNQ